MVCLTGFQKLCLVPILRWNKISLLNNLIGSSMSLDNIYGNSTQHLSMAWVLTSLKVPKGTPKGLLGLRFNWVWFVQWAPGYLMVSGTALEADVVVHTCTYMKDHYSHLGHCSITGKSGDPFSNMAGGAMIPALLTLLAIFPRALLLVSF